MKKEPNKKNSHSPLLSLFTLLQEGSAPLDSLYESLKNQTFLSFEWIILDSRTPEQRNSDKDTILSWQKTSPFPVSYEEIHEITHLKAFYQASQKAQGTWFLELPSSTHCHPDALEKIQKIWGSLPTDQNNSFATVWALWTDSKGKVLGGSFPGAVMDSTPTEVIYKYGMKEPKGCCYKTEILKTLPFLPEEENGDVPQAFLWHQISDEYKARFTNDSLGTDAPSMPPLEEEVSEKKIKGNLFFHHWCLSHHISWACTAPLQFLCHAFSYGYASWQLQKPWKEQLEKIPSSRGKFLFLITSPWSYLYFLGRNRSPLQMKKDDSGEN